MKDAFLTLYEFVASRCNLVIPPVKKGDWLENSYARIRARSDGYIEVTTREGRWLVPEDAKLADSEADLVPFLMACREQEIPLRPIRACDQEGTPEIDDRIYFFWSKNDWRFGAIRINYYDAFLYRYDKTQEFYYTEHSFTLPRLVVTPRQAYDIPCLLPQLKEFGKIKVGTYFFRFYNGRWEIAYDCYGEMWQPYDYY